MDKEWENVREACDKDQPRTATALLRPLEDAAFADHACEAIAPRPGQGQGHQADFATL